MQQSMATTDSRRYIRLVVRLPKKDDKTCRVDVSHGLSSVLEQISSKVQLDIQQLSHVVFKGGINVGTSDIDCVDVLQDFDIVEASGATPTKKKSSSTTSNFQPTGPATPKYQVGTKVQNKVGDNWIDGTILAIDRSNEMCKVQYSNGLSEWFEFHDRVFDKMVFYGKKCSPY